MADWTKTRLPRGDVSSPSEPTVRSATWLHPSLVRAALGSGDKFPKGRSPLILGYADDGGDKCLISHDDDRHAILAVGSRGGKSVSVITPNLLTYPGSMIVVDPKGELAMTTARHRRETLKQDVIVLDPYNVCANYGRHDLASGRFNPFEWLQKGDPELIEEVTLLADALMVKETQDVHFYETARSYIQSVCLHMIHDDRDQPIDLITMRERLMTGIGSGGVDLFLELLRGFPGVRGSVSRVASMIADMGERERGSVLSTAGRNTEFLDTEAMERVLRGKSSFDPRLIKLKPTTIYLVLPEWRLASHHRWLRLMISSLLSAMQRSPSPPPDKPATMLLIDEFAALGHMESIERAAGYIAGFGVKMVAVLQDLGQLKSLYDKRWETFVANAGVVAAFANADATTAEYISKRCGETIIVEMESNLTEGSNTSRSSQPLMQRLASSITDMIPHLGGHGRQTSRSDGLSVTPRLVPAPLITPDEVMVHFARETGSMMVLINGARPIRLNRIRYFDDPLFMGLSDRNPLYS